MWYEEVIDITTFAVQIFEIRISWIQRIQTKKIFISLSLNGNQMLVGKLDDQPSFWIDGDQKNCMDDHLSTPQITFKNGEVLSSYCKG